FDVPDCGTEEVLPEPGVGTSSQPDVEAPSEPDMDVPLQPQPSVKSDDKPSSASGPAATKSEDSNSPSNPTTSPSFLAGRCKGDPSGRIVENLSATSDESGYKVAIKPGDKGGVSWYADNNKIAAATSDMWDIAKPCILALPLSLNSEQPKSLYYQLNCHFWGQRFQWAGFSFGGTYDLETWRSAEMIPSSNIQLQLFYARTACNWT
ncbi:hypothetical protein, partial [Actinocorallia aurantiaca]|uniref:hypothetical protein n=1 Tax=Actinocorallia aurantiaca TaxID=46204 RepID=UPI0031D9ACF6